MFITIKYFTKNYEGIFILLYGVTKLMMHGIRTIAVEIHDRLIELHDVLYVLDIFETLYSIIEHNHQPDFLFVIKNRANTVGFSTFTLMEKTSKEIYLDVDLPFKDRHSDPDYLCL